MKCDFVNFKYPQSGIFPAVSDFLTQTIFKVKKRDLVIVTQNNMIKLGVYEHYKGKRYEVLGVAKHSETLEDLVVYKKLYDDGALWVRPLAMFLEDVEVDGQIIPRFKLIEEGGVCVMPAQAGI